MSFAGNIQTFRKNRPSENFPFQVKREQLGGEAEPKCTEYDQNFVSFHDDSKPALRRDQLREVYKKKLTQILVKNANEQLETLYRQEEERNPLRKRMNYYLAKDNSQDAQYCLERTDDTVTFWSYGKRRNQNHRLNNAFTKPHDEKLDVQFE
ncbi:uncharacterized protein LOC128277102 [Anopheles cruzii]|uniref:uncharacterized protein LOC128277102 n=1 Tax=Anopheles cruzii TaxID=68878 RepID=UPI0022EC5ED4|nr:uncharacterized protein LOC128277102 [Anopheles cruzii]